MNPQSIFQRLLPHWPGVVFSQRPDGGFAYISEGIEKLTGLPPGRWDDPAVLELILHKDDVAGFREHVRQSATAVEGRKHWFRIRHYLNGCVNHCSEFRVLRRTEQGELIGYEGYWLDVTRQKRMEHRLESLVWKDALEAVTLGFAHDFNNQLTGILSLSDAHLTQLDAQHPVCEGLALIKQNARQAAQLVQKLVHLHHSQPGGRSYQDLNTLAADFTSLLRRVISRRFEVSSELDAASLPLYVDPIELRQVLISLAMLIVEKFTDHGCLSVQTSRHDQWPMPHGFWGVIPRAPLACLTLRESGASLKAAQLAALLENNNPARTFTNALGLSLNLARRFAEKHGGSISINARDGEGTIFKLWLPQSDFTEADSMMPLVVKPRSILVFGADEPESARLADVLRKRGCEAIAASRDPGELLRCDDYHFDALLLTAGPQDLDLFGHLGWVRKHKLPIKTVVWLKHAKPGGSHTALLPKADMILPPDLPAESIPDKLAALWTTY